MMSVYSFLLLQLYRLLFAYIFLLLTRAAKALASMERHLRSWADTPTRTYKEIFFSTPALYFCYDWLGPVRREKKAHSNLNLNLSKKKAYRPNLFRKMPRKKINLIHTRNSYIFWRKGTAVMQLINLVMQKVPHTMIFKLLLLPFMLFFPVSRSIAGLIKQNFCSTMTLLRRWLCENGINNGRIRSKPYIGGIECAQCYSKISYQKAWGNQ